MNTSLQDKYDIVVIGAGVSGLLSGCLLAKAGLSVCIIEKSHRPGGYLMGFERGGFTFDTSTHWLNECGPGGMVRNMLNLVGKNAPETPPLTHIKRYKSASMDYRLTNNPDELRDQLCADFPSDKNGITRFFADCRAFNRDTWQIFRQQRRSVHTMSIPEQISTGIRMARPGLRMRKLSKSPVEKMLASYFSKDIADGMFRSDKNIVSCMFPIGWAYNGDYQRAPNGGGKQIPLWLASQFDALGGTLQLGCEVETLVLAGKQVTSVTLRQPDKSHQTVLCDHVIAACDAVSLFNTLLPRGAISQKRIRQFENADLYPSIFAINLGLHTDAANLGLDESLCYLTRDGLARDEHNGQAPERSAISVLSPSARDKTLAPQGKATLSIQTTVAMSYGDYWKTGPNYERTAAYREFKNAYASQLLDRVERDLIPGLSSRIEVMDIATPVTHQRFTNNYMGSIMGTRPTAANFRNRVGGYGTPIKNLTMAGHWSTPGGGVPIAVLAATNASLLLLKKIRPAVFKTYCAAVDQTTLPA